MLKLNSNTLATSCKVLTHWKRPWCWEGLGAGGEGDDRGWDGWWHHRLDGHEFEWTPGVGDGQGGLACCNSWVCKESDMTERLNWTEYFWSWWNNRDHVYPLHLKKKKKKANDQLTKQTKNKRKISQTNQNLKTKEKDPLKAKQQQKQVEIHESMSLDLGQEANRTVIPERRGRDGVLRWFRHIAGRVYQAQCRRRTKTEPGSFPELRT